MLTVRRVQMADIHALQSIEFETWGIRSSGYDVAIYAQSRCSFLADIDGVSVGYLVAACDMAGDVWVGAIAVLPGFRRQGIGRALYAALLLVAAGRTVTAYIEPGNEASRAMHAQLGFRTSAAVLTIDNDEVEVWTRSGSREGGHDA